MTSFITAATTQNIKKSSNTDRLKLISGTSNPSLAKEIAGYLGINDVPINTDVELADQLIKNKIGEKIIINIIRDKRFMKIGNITLKVFPVPTDKMYKDHVINGN